MLETPEKVGFEVSVRVDIEPLKATVDYFFEQLEMRKIRVDQPGQIGNLIRVAVASLEQERQ